MAHQFNSGYGQAPSTPAGGNPPQSTTSQPTPPPAPNEPNQEQK